MRSKRNHFALPSSIANENRRKWKEERRRRRSWNSIRITCVCLKRTRMRIFCGKKIRRRWTNERMDWRNVQEEAADLELGQHAQWHKQILSAIVCNHTRLRRGEKWIIPFNELPAHTGGYIKKRWNVSNDDDLPEITDQLWNMYFNERPEYLTGLAFDYRKSRALAAPEAIIISFFSQWAER